MPQPRFFPSVAVPIGAEGAGSIQRADIVVSGLEQAGPSFELRIFLDNPDADAETEPTEDAGYAGSVYVYGYGRPPEGATAQSGLHPRIPMTRYIMATDAIRAAAARGPAAAVTLVPVPFGELGAEIDLGDAEVSVRVNE
jgi:hypothetical protein